MVVAWYYSCHSPACGEAASGAPGGRALPPVSFHAAGPWGSLYAYIFLSQIFLSNALWSGMKMGFQMTGDKNEI